MDAFMTGYGAGLDPKASSPCVAAHLVNLLSANPLLYKPPGCALATRRGAPPILGQGQASERRGVVHSLRASTSGRLDQANGHLCPRRRLGKFFLNAISPHFLYESSGQLLLRRHGGPLGLTRR